MKNPKIEVRCGGCGNAFWRWPSQTGRFCSRACRTADLTGKQFGFLEVLGADDSRSHGQVVWRCRCDCGKEVLVPGRDLRVGHTKSCGCKKAEMAAAANRTHGYSGRKTKIPEYRIWGEMIRRCESPKNSRYYRYGARGIRVCDRWRRSFAAFLEDMGRRPDKSLSIDRIDNDGNYEPGNCRWATRKQQARNRSRTVKA